MDILKMLADLRAERDRLSEAILTMERLAAGQGRRRGRPPNWMKDKFASRKMVTGPGPTFAKPRRKFSVETRHKMAAAQKRRWAAKKGTA